MLPHLNPFRIATERRWVAAAQAAVEDYFHHPPPGTDHLAIGSFQGLSGKGYDYPVWNINAAHLIALRTANFSQGTISVRIYVWEPDPGRTANGTWTIERVDDETPHGGGFSVFVRMK